MYSVDYGMILFAPYSEVFAIHEKFTEHPAFAIHCSLGDEYSCTEVLSKITKHVTVIIDMKPTEIKTHFDKKSIDSVTGESIYEVDLDIDEQLLSDRLLLADMIAKIQPNLQLSRLVGQNLKVN